MGDLFGIIIVRPLGLILMGIYWLIQNYGWSIIIFTLVVKLILLPFMYKQKKSMKKMAVVNVEVQKLQKRYANNREKANEEIAKLYEKEHVNPMSGCLLSFVTLPIMLALYYAVRKPMTFMMGLGEDTISSIASAIGQAYDPSSVNGQIALAKEVHEHWSELQSFVSQGLVNLDFNFFGLDLSAVPNFRQFNAIWFVPIISGLTALGSSLIMQRMQKKQNPQQAAAMANNSAASTMNTMLVLMPLMSVWIAYTFPVSMGLYWIVNNIFTFLQEILLTWFIVRFDKAEDDEDTKERKRRQEEHEKRLEMQAERAAEGRALRDPKDSGRNVNTSKKKLKQQEVAAKRAEAKRIAEDQEARRLAKQQKKETEE